MGNFALLLLALAAMIVAYLAYCDYQKRKFRWMLTRTDLSELNPSQREVVRRNARRYGLSDAFDRKAESDERLHVDTATATTDRLARAKALDKRTQQALLDLERAERLRVAEAEQAAIDSIMREARKDDD